LGKDEVEMQLGASENTKDYQSKGKTSFYSFFKSPSPSITLFESFFFKGSIIFLRFIYLKEHTTWGWGVQREGERISSRLLAEMQSLTWGSVLLPWDHDLSQNQELDA